VVESGLLGVGGLVGGLVFFSKVADSKFLGVSELWFVKKIIDQSLLEK